MTDPYNNPFSGNPYSPPQARVAPARKTAVAGSISNLDVSEPWKERFRPIEKAGGPDLPRIRELPPGERRKIGFNGWAYLLAFLFGPVHFFVKGLWRQGISYFLVTVAPVLLLDAFGIDPHAAIAAGMAAVYATRINIGYYRKVVLDEAPWV